MIENGLYVFRCIRCTATFSLRWKDEKYGEQFQWRALEANPCRVCGKGSVEYVGYMFYTPEESSAPPR